MAIGVALAAGLPLFVADVAGQQWQLPECGAAEYRRETAAAVSAVHRSARAARDAELLGAARCPERLVPGIAPAPFLCEGELDRDRRAIEGPVRDLRDVLRAVAFDLGAGGGGRFACVVPYGDLAVSGSWHRRGADGSEELRATVRGRPSRDARLSRFCARGCSGRLALTRRFDADRGVVASFDGEIDLVVDEGERRFRRVRVRDAWELVAVRHNQDVDFRLRVAAAIRGGAAFVRAAIAADRSYLDGSVTDRRSYGSGRLALGLLALLHAHVPPDDAVVRDGFRELLRRRLVDTYSLGAALMALGRLGAARPLGERERAAAEKWLDRLLENVDPRTDRREVLRFNYVRAPRYDTSVQQYGLLGMAAARRCGVAVDGAAFAAAARHLLAVQCPSAGRHAWREVSHAALRAAAGESAAGEKRRTRCRGFAYVDADEPPFGSMTAAGISGLLLARDGMAAAGHTEAGLTRAIGCGVQDGFGWLARELSLRCNPGFAERGRFHWYYWLYCLERSCELAGIARLDGRDWYYEGALQLIAQQQPSGAFSSGGAADLQIDATCFAVLFLAKATAKAAVTRGG